MYGLQEGYQPFCQNISYPLPVWYTKSLPSFTPLTDNDPTRVIRIQAGISSPPILRLQYKAFSGARMLEVPDIVYTRLSIPVKIDEVLKKAPQNRVNIFDNVEEVDMFDRDLDILKQERNPKEKSGMNLKSLNIKEIVKNRKKDSEEEKELYAAAQASKHNRLKTDVLPEKNYNLGKYEHDHLLNATRYVFSGLFSDWSVSFDSANESNPR